MFNVVIFISVLFVCCYVGFLEEGFYLFYNMEGEFGVKFQIEYYGCIVDFFGRVGYLREVYDFVIRMLIKLDFILWRSLFGLCRFYGDLEMGERVGKIFFRV